MAAHAQNSIVAMLKSAQQDEPARPAARGTSLESILQEFQTTHHAFFLCRSELLQGKYVNVEALTFRTWEEKLTYVITVSGLRLEKTGRNVYIISAPKNPGSSLQTIGAGASPVALHRNYRGGRGSYGARPSGGP